MRLLDVLFNSKIKNVFAIFICTAVFLIFMIGWLLLNLCFILITILTVISVPIYQAIICLLISFFVVYFMNRHLNFVFDIKSLFNIIRTHYSALFNRTLKE
ncbi:hypothetical protein B5723_08090 [Mammaliicoccus sciuri]|nr:hypothetical protein B5723_08090 [Mammaliicoccus sciuri]